MEQFWNRSPTGGTSGAILSPPGSRSSWTAIGTMHVFRAAASAPTRNPQTSRLALVRSQEADDSRLGLEVPVVGGSIPADHALDSPRLSTSPESLGPVWSVSAWPGPPPSWGFIRASPFRYVLLSSLRVSVSKRLPHGVGSGGVADLSLASPRQLSWLGTSWERRYASLVSS